MLDETGAFFRRAWWLAITSALPGLASYAMWRLPMPWDNSAGVRIVNAMTAFAVVALTYWVVRFIALEHDLRAALGVDRNSVRTFLPYAVTAFSIIWLSLTVSTMIGNMAGTTLRLLPEFLFFLAPWAMTAPSRSNVIGPVRSVKLVAPHLGWAIGLLFAVLLLNTILVFGVGFLGGRLTAGTALTFLGGFSLASTIGRAAIEVAFNVIFPVATYALALRTGVRVNEAAGLSAVFE
ncbi:hypothetical protein GRI89_16570 [Altererythrobacter salegens]|uniref:Uncharacterized protein n=1 Tax=Croceibacterium salegens TaxID=1737568 RepID=A0A6I4T0N5_9SPHN|nr:hypothetical protein [Croceibacterium salegens]MXO61159.1 hypothetical protein [Croceibacterium salegens]